MKNQAMCKTFPSLVLTLLLSMLLVTAFFASSKAEITQTITWTVDDDSTADFSTIQAAVDAANVGDTVYVRSGEFHEHVLINKSIQLLGENTDAIVDGGFIGDVFIVAANEVTISGFTIQNSGKRPATYEPPPGGPAYEGICGVYVNGYVGVRIVGNILTNNFVGISMESCSNVAVSENLIKESYGDAGIRVALCSSVTINKNRLTLSNISGAVIYQCSNSIVTENQIVENIVGGIVLSFKSNHITVSNNNISGNDFHGLNIVNANENSVYGNNMSDNYYGVCFSGGVDNDVYGNYIEGNYYAVAYYDSAKGQAHDNELVNNVNNEYILNTVWASPTSDPFATPVPSDTQPTPTPTQTPTPPGNGRRIVVPDDYATIQGAINSASDGDMVFVKKGRYSESLTINKSIYLLGEGKSATIVSDEGTTACLIQHDNVYVSGFTFKKPSTMWWYHGIHLLNVKYCSVFDNYLVSIHEGIWLFGSSNNNIYGNVVWDNYCGMVLSDSHHNIIHNNTVTECYTGITVAGSNYNSITNNRVLSNEYVGIDFSGDMPPCLENLIAQNIVADNRNFGIQIGSFISSDTKIVGNNITENGATDGDAGIRIAWTNRIHIIDNNIVGNHAGIILYSTNNNTITGNFIGNNTQGALYIDSVPDWTGTPNLIYENTIMNPVVFTGTIYSARWDNGTVGNYWFDYTGTDIDNDDVGDTPYNVYVDNTDNHPLMKPIIPSILSDTSSTASQSQPTLATTATPTPTSTHTPTPESISTMVVTASASAATVIAGSLLVYLKKRQKTKST